MLIPILILTNLLSAMLITRLLMQKIDLAKLLRTKEDLLDDAYKMLAGEKEPDCLVIGHSFKIIKQPVEHFTRLNWDSEHIYYRSKQYPNSGWSGIGMELDAKGNASYALVKICKRCGTIESTNTAECLLLMEKES